MRKEASHKKFKQSNNVTDFLLRFARNAKYWRKYHIDTIKNIENLMKDFKQFWSYIHSKYKHNNLPNTMTYENTG